MQTYPNLVVRQIFYTALNGRKFWLFTHGNHPKVEDEEQVDNETIENYSVETSYKKSIFSVLSNSFPASLCQL